MQSEIRAKLPFKRVGLGHDGTRLISELFSIGAVAYGM